ncbi:MAG: FkbM family methyltransferase [Gemmataceae bacterium]|nr:FkbM family methyltransferase [Gemmataceae bacterium]
MSTDICRGCAYPDVASLPTAGVRSPCLYRGNLWRSAPKAHGPDRGQPVEVFSCGFHGECTESRAADGLACCATCAQFRPRDTSPARADAPENSVQSMTAILRGPRRDWPADWPYWGTTLEAHRLLAAEFERQIPPYPAGRFLGRGIVILGGGPFFPGVYVNVRMIRHFGCQLPIEVWHHAQSQPVVAHWLEPLGVRFVDIDAHMDGLDPPPRLRGAWASKMYAILHCSFEEALYLDSDCYPLADVTPLFDLRAASILWPNPPGRESSIDWFVYPTTPSEHPSINGGIVFVNKATCWKALTLAQWWNEHADYVYRHGFGDEDVLRGVWQQQQQPFVRFADRPAWYDSRLQLDPGPDGQTPLFLHRYNDKLRLACLPICSSAAGGPALYRQDVITGEPRYDPSLPQEEVAFGYFRQFLYQLDNDPRRYHAGTADRAVWEEIAIRNAYRLPDQLPAGSLVIDVGAHIGSFTHLALRRGAAQVWAFEASADNWARCSANLVLWGRRVVLRRQAVWSHRGRAGFVPATGSNTGIGRVIPDGNAVETISLDEVLDEVSEDGTKPIYMLKLDCEGAEWPILFASERLALCENIVGEYHGVEWEGQPRGPHDLCRVLRSHGFAVRTSPLSDALGLFWATRSGSLLGEW